ncbi:MAG: hypothetical protein KGS48_03685 [Bacteroidetes bacterium]|nr:hypothetical protein [Bacteroidota bacterium]
MKNIKYILPVLLGFAFWVACHPYEADDVTLPALPAAPSFSINYVQGDSNRVVVTDNSTGYFERFWDFSGGVPGKSARAQDTIFYPKSGTYTITLYGSATGGAGTAQSVKVVNIKKDAQAQCDPQVSLLTGNCEAPGKCWTFSTAAGAVSVGPTPGSSEWYKSPLNGLQAAQYDDSFCFYFDNTHFQYYNNGGTVDPFNGYIVIPFNAPSDLKWILSKGTGAGGLDQILLPNGAFLGVMDSGPNYDIVSMTETTLVVRSKIINSTGWFELTFVKK